MAFGRLERTPCHTPLSEINVTPLVDVMMVLLVIFIITAPLMVSSLKLHLPQAEGAASAVPTRFVKLAINAEGQLYLDDHPVSQAELARALAERATEATRSGNGELPEVQLRADARVPYGRVVELMGLAQKLGMNRIGFVIERKAAPGKP